MYEEIAACIRKRADCTGQIHAQYLDAVSNAKIFGSQLFLRFLCGFYTHIFFKPGHFFTKLCTFLLHFSGSVRFFTEFIVLSNRFIGKFFCFAQNGLSFFAGFLKNSLAVCFETVLFALKTLFETFNFLLIAVNLFLLFFYCSAAFFQIRDYILKAFIFLRNMSFCFFNDVIRKSELLRNCKCVALSGNANQQAVCWTQCLDIKLTASVLYARGRKGKYL